MPGREDTPENLDGSLPEQAEPLEPPPTYNVPIACLVVSLVLAAMNVYMVVYQARIEVKSLFLLPGAFLLGVFGLIDPRIPSSLLPGARGYPAWARVIGNGCWIVSLAIGAILYFGVVQ